MKFQIGDIVTYTAFQEINVLSLVVGLSMSTNGSASLELIGLWDNSGPTERLIRFSMFASEATLISSIFRKEF